MKCSNIAATKYYAIPEGFDKESVVQIKCVGVNAFVLSVDGVDFHNSRKAQLEWLLMQGFDVVEFETVNKESLPGGVESFSEKVPSCDFPSDGLVLLMDDIAYGESLGRKLRHFPAVR